jgi:hypothetical protein
MRYQFTKIMEILEILEKEKKYLGTRKTKPEK